MMDSFLLREAKTRALSAEERGFTAEERKALDDYEGFIQSGHPSDVMDVEPIHMNDKLRSKYANLRAIGD